MVSLTYAGSSRKLADPFTCCIAHEPIARRVTLGARALPLNIYADSCTRNRIPYTGAWHQTILHMHPSPGRGATPLIEWGDTRYPTGESGFNYFDALTVFYIDFVGMGGYHSLAKYPAIFYFDDFEFYKDTNPENVEQIFSLNGVYAPADNRIYVGWSHPKDDDKTKYEVRYAFQDIYSLPNQWKDALQAPGGTVSPPGGVYNATEYSTKDIKVAGHDTIYMAIKPRNSDLFRQIALPVKMREPVQPKQQ